MFDYSNQNNGSQDVTFQINNEIPSHFTSFKVQAKQCLEDIILYQIVQKSIDSQECSKKVFLVQIDWFNQFKKYSKEIEFRQQEIQQAVKQDGSSFIDLQSPKPGPIQNFDLVDFEFCYTDKLQQIYNTAPNSWKNIFYDWNYMTLNSDIKQGKDYILISQTSWQKLYYIYGGAPEIPIFMIKNQGASSGDFQNMNNSQIADLNPIKLNLVLLENNENRLTILISQYIGPKVLLQCISQLISNPPSKIFLFLQQVEKDIIFLKEIKTKGTIQDLLIDLGIQDNSTLYVKCYLDTLNISQLYNEVMNLVPNSKIISSNSKENKKANSNKNLDNIIDDNYFEPQQFRNQNQQSKNVENFTIQKRRYGRGQNLLPNQNNQNIPPEYQNDPELYWALQASLMPINEQFINEQQQDNVISGWYDQFQNEENFEDLNQNINRQTPSTNEIQSNCASVNNESFMSNQDKVDQDVHNIFPQDNPQIKVSNLGQDKQNYKKKNNQQMISKQEKMKKIREGNQERFIQMQMRAYNAMVDKDNSKLAIMGSIKSFSDLTDSILKIRETFDDMLGKKENLSPLKQKDMRNEFWNQKSTFKEQECETDEEDK